MKEFSILSPLSFLFFFFFVLLLLLLLFRAKRTQAKSIKQLQMEIPDVYDRMSSLSLQHFDPSLEEKWWILDLHLKDGLIATMPIRKASEAFRKWKLIFKNLPYHQRISLKKIDLSLSHPTLSF